MLTVASNLAICHACPRRQPCSGACACAANGLDIIVNAKRGDCPEDRFNGALPLPAEEQILDRLQEVGPSLWAELHAMAWTIDHPSSAPWWVESNFTPRVPFGSCDCAAHWLEYRLRHPVPGSSRLAIFAWSVDAHDDVRLRQGKPRFGFAAALAIYQAKLGKLPATEGDSNGR